MSNDLHKGHRKRLKARFLREGNFAHFDPHNILELLLFYSVPLKDTNEIAHTLINKFGSISGVFDADYRELLSVSGVSEHSATLLKILPQICSVYYNEETQGKAVLDTPQKLREFIVNKYIGINVEQVYILCLDNTCKVLAGEFLFKGSVCSAGVDMRTLADFAIKHRATGVVVAHNHPNAEAKISNDDVIATAYIKNALKMLDITLLEHIIVSPSGECIFSEEGYL